MSRGSVLDRTPISADDWRKVGGGPANLMADALDEIARLRERIEKLEACVKAARNYFEAEANTYLPIVPDWNDREVMEEAARWQEEADFARTNFFKNCAALGEVDK